MAADGLLVRYVHGDTEGTREAERLQAVLQEGPCADALVRARPVVIKEDPLRSSWACARCWPSR